MRTVDVSLRNTNTHRKEAVLNSVSVEISVPVENKSPFEVIQFDYRMT